MAFMRGLGNIKILVTDPDPLVGNLSVSVLQGMGFTQTAYVSDGAEALHRMQSEDIDVLITEWQMPRLKGLDMVSLIRRSKDSSNPIVPTMMLTGRAEAQDVQLARDLGINEFLIKPYSAHSIFERMKRLVDHPRDFVLAEKFVGPDRRRKAVNVADNRRKLTLPVTPKWSAALRQQPMPQLIKADEGLKRKIGVKDSLGNVLTPDHVRRAQQVINEMRRDSFKWVKEDLEKAESFYQLLRQSGADDTKAIEQFQEAMLLVKSRSGIFGYELISTIAQQLYSFSRNHYLARNQNHNLVLNKHLQALRTVVKYKIEDMESDNGKELVQNLHRLSQKLRAG